MGAAFWLGKVTKKR